MWLVLFRVLLRGVKVNKFDNVQMYLWYESTNGCNSDVGTDPTLGNYLSTHQQKNMDCNQRGYLLPINCRYPPHHHPDPHAR